MHSMCTNTQRHRTFIIHTSSLTPTLSALPPHYLSFPRAKHLRLFSNYRHIQIKPPTIHNIPTKPPNLHHPTLYLSAPAG